MTAGDLEKEPYGFINLGEHHGLSTSVLELNSVSLCRAFLSPRVHENRIHPGRKELLPDKFLAFITLSYLIIK